MEIATFDEKFARLSAECRRNIRGGQIDLYSANLKEMAKLLDEEGRFADELRMLIPAFYIDLSGFGRAPYIDVSVPEMLQTAILNSGMDKRQLTELYFDLIHPDFMPKHLMSVKESLYVFQLCVEGKVKQAEYLLTRI